MAERLNGHHKTHTHTHTTRTHWHITESINFKGADEASRRILRPNRIGSIRSRFAHDNRHYKIVYICMYIFIGYINILYICVWAALWGSDFYRSSDKRSATDHKRKDNNSDWDGWVEEEIHDLRSVCERRSADVDGLRRRTATLFLAAEA